MSIEDKHPQAQPAETGQSVADDLLVVMDVEDQEARMNAERKAAFLRFQADKISGEEYNDLVQVGTYSEGDEVGLQLKKKAALDRLNGGTQTKLGHRVINLFRYK